MGTTPDQLKTEIDRTRDDLTSNVNALADKVSPTKITKRRLRAVKDGATGVKDKVMGSANDAATNGGASVTQMTGSVAETVSGAPEMVSRQARGNPLPAALIAFGAGALVATLLPETESETRVAESLQAHGVDVVGAAKSTAAESAQRLKGSLAPQAQRALTSVKDAATDAAQTTRGDAQRAAGDLSSHGKQAAKQVRGRASSAKESTTSRAKKTTTSTRRTSSTGGKASDVHVVHRDGTWVVEQKGSGVISTHRTQALAEQAGRRRARRDRTEFVLHGTNGRIRAKDSYGNDPRGRG